MAVERTRAYGDDARPGRRPVPRGPRRRPHAGPASTSTDRSTRSRATSPRRSTPTRSPRLPAPRAGTASTAWRAQLTDIVRDVVRPGLRRATATCCATSCCPSPGPTTAPASSTSTTGPRCTGRSIEMHTGLPLTADELHAIGMDEVTGSLPAEFAEVGGRQFGTDDLPTIFGRLLDDADLRYRDGDEIIAHAAACLDAATAAMGDWFGILPEAPCVLTPVPDYLAADAPAAYYTPPAPDGSRPGRVPRQPARPHRPRPGRDRVDRLPRGDPRPPPAARHRLRAHRPARVPPPVVGPHRVRRGLGALHRAAGRRDGPLRERPRPARDAGQRRVAGLPAGRRHRPARPGLDPPAGDRLHGRPRPGEPRRDRRRGRPLHRHARPGAGLQGRPARDPAPAGRRPGRARARRSTSRASTTPCSAAPRSASASSAPAWRRGSRRRSRAGGRTLGTTSDGRARSATFERGCTR